MRSGKDWNFGQGSKDRLKLKRKLFFLKISSNLFQSKRAIIGISKLNYKQNCAKSQKTHESR